MTTINVPQNLIGNVALVAGGLRVGVNDDVGGEASGRAGLSVVVDGVVVKFLPRISEETASFFKKRTNQAND